MTGALRTSQTVPGAMTAYVGQLVATALTLEETSDDETTSLLVAITSEVSAGEDTTSMLVEMTTSEVSAGDETISTLEELSEAEATGKELVAEAQASGTQYADPLIMEQTVPSAQEVKM